MSIGGVVLKFFERYIRKYPQEWYQWQKCAEIKTLESNKESLLKPPSFPFLKQSLSKVT
jgi:hypothetical protein